MHHLRTGLILACAVAATAFAVPAAAQPHATVSPAPQPSPTPSAAPALTPANLPSPITSLPPASQPSTLPYPAYGTPAPGVDRGVPVKDAKPVVTLDQAIAVGFARSPLLAQARAAVLIATAPVNLAKTAIFPRLNGTASTTHTDRQAGSGSGGSGSGGSGSGGSSTFGGTTNSLAVQLSQLIYDGGRVAAQLRAAKANQVASLALYKRQLQTVAFNISNSYYAALAAQRVTEVSVATVQLNQVNEDLVSAQVRAGTASQVDLATAQLPTAQARVALVKAQGAELSAQAAFVNAMGLDANAYVLPQDDGNVLAGGTFTPSVSIPTYDQAIARALMLRPDYYAAVQSVEGFEASLRAAKLGLFPTLNGSASAGTASTDPGGGTFRNASSVGLTLSIPIYDGGVTAAQVMQVQGQLDQASASLQSTKLNVQLNVKQTLVNLVAARGAFDQTQAELSKAQEVLKATQAQYRAGVTTLPLLLNAQVGITQALTDQVTALYTLRQAEAAFSFAEGANAPA
jgi:outer membrane protein